MKTWPFGAAFSSQRYGAKRMSESFQTRFYDQEGYTIQHNKPRALYMTLTPLQENGKLIE